MMHTLTLTPQAVSATITRIVLGEGILSALSDHLSLPTYDGCAVLVDAAVKLMIADSLKALSPRVIMTIEHGEHAKTLADVDRLSALMIAAGCSRRTLLVSIGGGATTDLGGFVASVYMRGMPCAHIPTTLLGMVDAAIGGKSAINAGQRKNMLGTVHHPSVVLIDTNLLDSLPDDRLREGLVEVVKIAAITDATFFVWLESHLDSLLARESALIEECIRRAVEAKMRIVSLDSLDAAGRQLLNFGHTVGHALEALSSGGLSHGHAVSIGMSMEMKLASSLAFDRTMTLLQRLATPLAIPFGIDPEQVWQRMLSDKKSHHGTVRISVPDNIGRGSMKTLSKDLFLSLFPS